MVKLRLKCYGRKQRITYRIVAIDARARREGKSVREIGFYNPRQGDTQLDFLTITSLLRSGAKLTKPVRNIIKRVNVGISSNS
uniref:Small ribosomal subunit protein bS16c n=1 Tax=Vaginularia trichoidea TaxID=474354 RepID=A0A3G5CT74_9MONI|nr:ribosomal protein S16 [Vaginularia trichoidea]AYW16054.1 ribosomal protein S16 [Vaginularia trichoidea]